MDEIPLKPAKIKYEGLFDMTGLYRFIRKWLADRRYIFIEKQYKHKVPSPLGAEVELTWRAWRKESEFLKTWIDVYFHFWDLTEVEVIKDGKKKKMFKARFEIRTCGSIQPDYQGRFDRTPFHRALGKFYFKFFVNFDKELGMWWDDHYYLVYKLQTGIKKFLGMHTSESGY